MSTSSITPAMLPFSFFEKNTKLDWERGRVLVVDNAGKKELYWDYSQKIEEGTNQPPSCEEIEKVAFAHLASALSSASYSALELKRCLKNVRCLILQNHDRASSLPLSKLSPLASSALKQVESAVQNLSHDAQYERHFVSIRNQAGETTPLSRQKSNQHSAASFELTTLSSIEIECLVHFLESGCLSGEEGQDLLLMLAQVESFNKVLSKHNHLALQAVLEKRLVESLKISTASQLFSVLEWAQRCAFSKVIAHCVKTYFSQSIQGFGSEQKQKIAVLVKQRFPRAVEALLYYAEHKELSPACLEKNKDGVRLLFALQMAAKNYGLTDLESHCTKKIKSFVEGNEANAQSSLRYLEVFGNSGQKELVISALKNILVEKPELFSKTEQEIVKKYLKQFHGPLGDTLSIFWTEGIQNVKWQEGSEKQKTIIELLALAQLYDLPQLVEQIESKLIAESPCTLSSLLWLVKLTVTLRRQEEFKALRTYLKQKLSADWILRLEKGDPSCLSYIFDTVNEANEDVDWISHFLQVGCEIKYRDLEIQCVQHLSDLPFSMLSQEQQRIATTILLEEWFADLQREELPTEIQRLFQQNKKAFIALIAEKGRSVSCLNFEGKSNPLNDDELITLASACESLDTLRFSDAAALTDRGFEALAAHNLPLRDFALRFSSISNTGLTSLPGNQLTHLSLAHCKNITVEGINSIGQNFPMLVDLHLKAVPVSQKALQSIAKGCQKLKRLYLADNCTITGRDFASSIEGFQQLTELKIESCSALDNKAVEAFDHHLKSLEGLSIENCPQLTLNCISHIAMLPFSSFRRLEIDLPLNDNALITLCRAFPHLTDLKCNAVRLTDNGMNVLAANCEELKNLSLWGSSRITDQGLIPVIEKNPQLKSVDLEGCKKGITDLSLKFLAENCQELKYVGLENTTSNFTDWGLNFLLENKSLEKLNLREANWVSPHKKAHITHHTPLNASL